MKKHFLRIGVLLAGVLSLSACSNNAETGALIGSLVGAGIGKSTANHHDRRALVGGALGAIVGGAIGAEQDRSRSVAKRTVYSSEPVNQKVVVDDANVVRHTHKLPSGDQTHTHAGGDVQHSHSHSTRYVYDEPYYYPYSSIRPTIILSGSYHRHKHRHYRHKHRRHHRHHKHHHHYRRHRY